MFENKLNDKEELKQGINIVYIQCIVWLNHSTHPFQTLLVFNISKLVQVQSTH